MAGCAWRMDAPFFGSRTPPATALRRRCSRPWPSSYFITAAWSTTPPAEIMEAVNNDFRSIFGARSFMTAMCVALDPATGRATVVGAGHPPLLVARTGGTNGIDPLLRAAAWVAGTFRVHRNRCRPGTGRRLFSLHRRHLRGGPRRKPAAFLEPARGNVATTGGERADRCSTAWWSRRRRTMAETRLRMTWRRSPSGGRSDRRNLSESLNLVLPSYERRINQPLCRKPKPKRLLQNVNRTPPS